MNLKFADVEMAFDFVSSERPEVAFAVINRLTGEIFYRSDMSGLDEFPDDVDDNEKYLYIPHKNDLELGKSLVLRFVAQSNPADTNKVLGFFERKGAYSHFKVYLERIGNVQQWYDFEASETAKALHLWCDQNNLTTQ
jgi:hypothetical protein